MGNPYNQQLWQSDTRFRLPANSIILRGRLPKNLLARTMQFFVNSSAARRRPVVLRPRTIMLTKQCRSAAKAHKRSDVAIRKARLLLAVKMSPGRSREAGVCRRVDPSANDLSAGGSRALA